MKYMKLGSKTDVFQSDGNNIRFVATELDTDIIINVGDVKFHLHKFPLLSKSSHLQKLVAATNDENVDEISIHDIPGGPAAFETCAKFCYGMVVTLNAYNVVAARCAAEYLEMHETMEKGNLIYKIEVFLNSSILRTWKDSIIVLQTTKSLLPWAEDLKIISHCVESIASKASVDPSEVEWSYTYNRKKLPSENGLDSQWNGVRISQSVPKDWWVEDLCDLEIDSYKRVIVSVKTKGKVSNEVIGEALKAYTYRRIPGLVKGALSYPSDAIKYQSMLETIVWLLPSEPHSVSCGFLLKLLRAVSMLECGETSKKELINMIGRQLEEASVVDLLFPAVAGDGTVYNVDLVMSIVEEFIMQTRGIHQISDKRNQELIEIRSPTNVSGSSLIAVTKLIDGYLAEIAKDPNLPLTKFTELAEMVPALSRPVHDGLYRSIDMYLKEHPDLTKGEKKKICGLLDCKRLSADACMHAVQNDRLPLRVVVQVLFFEQMRASAAAGSVGADLPGSVRSLLLRENGGSHGSSRSAATTTAEDDWDGVPTAGDIKSLASVGKGGGSQRSSGSSDLNKNGDHDKVQGSKVKGIMMPKKILSKLWSSKASGRENSSSDTSESPGSINQEDSKSTPSRITRNSVS